MTEASDVSLIFYNFFGLEIEDYHLQGVFSVHLDSSIRFWAHLIWAPKSGKPGEKYFNK